MQLNVFGLCLCVKSKKKYENKCSKNTKLALVLVITRYRAEKDLNKLQQQSLVRVCVLHDAQNCWAGAVNDCSSAMLREFVEARAYS